MSLSSSTSNTLAPSNVSRVCDVSQAVPGVSSCRHESLINSVLPDDGPEMTAEEQIGCRMRVAVSDRACTRAG